MDRYEIARRASSLPQRFADRIPRDTLEIIELMDGGGEYGELTIELAASLAAHKTPVTPEERDELRALLEAMNMPTDPIEQLNVQADALSGRSARPLRPGGPRPGPARCYSVPVATGTVPHRADPGWSRSGRHEQHGALGA